MNAVFNKEKERFELDSDYALHCVSTDEKCEDHTHAYVEFVYCFSGLSLNYVDGVPYWLAKGDMLVVNEGSVHALYPRPQSNYCDIMLKPSFFDKDLSQGDGVFSLFELEEFSGFVSGVKKQMRLIHFGIEDQKKIECRIRTTVEEQQSSRTAAVPMRRAALVMLLTLIFRYMSEQERFGVNAELLEYIKEHAAQRLNAGMLAQRCYYTIEHFSRKFKQLTGKTFTAYLTECRLDIAEDLLKRTRKTVDTVISLSGFSSRGEFFKKFAERFGMTPLEYRNINNRY